MESERATFSVVIVYLLAMSAALAGGGHTSALDRDDGQPGSAPTAASLLLDALACTRLEGELNLDFTDWQALRVLHGGADITSANPLEDRQRLMLDIARSEWTTATVGLDRLATWPAYWGWDDTDLAWEVSSDSIGPGRVLRFRDDWDPSPFMARLEESGYRRSDKAYGTTFTPGPDTDVPSKFRLERLLGWEPQIQDQPLVAIASVAISPDGSTVVVMWGGGAHRVLKTAARTDPAAIAASPFGRVAIALGRPLAANIVNGRHSCPGPVAGVDLVPAEAAALVRSVGPLHPCQAFGTGYQRAGMGDPAIGRYVFAYEKVKQAETDLAGRRTLIDEGYSLRHHAPYRDAAFTLIEAVADGRDLVFDVALLNDTPRTLFDLLISRSMSFAACDGRVP